MYFSEEGDQQHLHAVLDPVVEDYVKHEEEERVGFRRHLEDYVRLYAFLSHSALRQR